ncbi:MAG: two-component system response regulator [Alteromonadaceae bacterium]|nr:MAG: two-component system response regulator [Alteromonadaceae bacterium]
MHEIKNRPILIVDDELANLKLLEKTLSYDGYTKIALIQDSRNVLAHYQSARPDLVLLDLNMPHLNGFSILEAFRALDDPLMPPVIVITAQDDRESLVKAFELGARDFITKPFDRLELLMRVRNLLEVYAAHRYQRKENKALEEVVHSRTVELRRTKLEIIRRLGKAAEYKDEETGNHILRMSRVSELIGRGSGCNSEGCELLLHASPMHDIGKIGIPDKILLKPGKLTPDEFEIMKTHAKIGAELLSGDSSEVLTTASIIALMHHEKWDGSGYPKGLKGDSIHPFARIVAAADVFDALMSDRPYKKAWTADESFKYLSDNSGSHFDPEVIRVFLSLRVEVLEIYAEYG